MGDQIFIDPCDCEVRTSDSPSGIPSGFARRDAGKLGGRRTSPATLSLPFGNLLDFVSAAREEKQGGRGSLV